MTLKKFRIIKVIDGFGTSYKAQEQYLWYWLTLGTFDELEDARESLSQRRQYIFGEQNLKERRKIEPHIEVVDESYLEVK